MQYVFQEDRGMLTMDLMDEIEQLKERNKKLEERLDSIDKETEECWLLLDKRFRAIEDKVFLKK
jgi:hypothetical protein|tara:strand:- start:354 stop:545 length:192 start_codon:yes stop_codon:yes gene_type:complete